MGPKACPFMDFGLQIFWAYHHFPLWAQPFYHYFLWGWPIMLFLWALVLWFFRPQQVEKALTTLRVEMTVSSSTRPSLDDNPVSNSLDLTSNIALRSLTRSLNQSTDWRSKRNKSASTKFKLFPPPTKSSTKGQKLREIPKKAPKRAKRKETEEQSALTSELLSMELRKRQKRGKILKKPKAHKKKRKREKSETHRKSQ